MIPSPHVSVSPPVNSAPAGTARVVRALDLTQRPDASSLWRPSATGAAGAPPADLPRPGRASPMGFWLSEDSAGPPPPGAAVYELRVVSPGGAEAAADSPGPALGFGRPPRTVKLKGPSPEDGEVVLTVSERSARVVARESAWAALAEPVTLAVCQCWRFAAIDADLVRLTEAARGDLGHAAMTRVSTVLNHRRLVATAVEIRGLLIDLAHFAGPLTDPRPFLSSDRAVQAYRGLAEKIELEAWSEAIDERAEGVEDTYASVTEKLFEYKNFAWGALFELVIVVLLAAEVGVQCLSYWSE